MSTLAPSGILFPLYRPVTEDGRSTVARPFGLTLAKPSPGGVVLDLTSVTFDPTTQTAVGTDGVPFASKKQTTQKVTTTTKTTHDHQSWNDSTQDTYQD